MCLWSANHHTEVDSRDQEQDLRRDHKLRKDLHARELLPGILNHRETNKQYRHKAREWPEDIIDKKYLRGL